MTARDRRPGSARSAPRSLPSRAARRLLIVLVASVTAALSPVLGPVLARTLTAPAPLSASAIPATSPATSLVSYRSAQARAGRSAWIEPEPSAADLQRQQALAARLQATAKLQLSGVDGAKQALQAAALLAGQALERSAAAVRGLQAAQDGEQRRQDALAAASAQVQRRQQALGRWARQVYQSGSELSTEATLSTLLSARSGTDVGTSLKVLRGVGTARDRDLNAMLAAEASASAAAIEAAAATQQASTAAIEAASEQSAAEDAVAVQRRMLAEASLALSATQQEQEAARARQAGLAAARVATAGGLGAGAAAGNVVTGAIGSCAGGAPQLYPNGQIPLSALCPLQSAPGHYLRADAAFAFDRMSYGYANQFGRPVCVTDSYRSYAQQVSLFARKPALAAVPGTSNHGLGTAVDLCGGVERFDTAQHDWLLLNAPLYGWFHPGWAEPTGSKPEPWHWEYSG